jgi:uncharacterized protein
MSPRPSPPPPRQLEELSYADCLARLAAKSLGHLSVVIGHYPQVFPVNYRLDDNIVVFRTHSGRLLVAANHANVGFQVDHVDPATKTGWSVLVQGMAEDVSDRDGSDPIAKRSRGLGVEPWVPGEKPRFVRIIPAHITGRELGPDDLAGPIAVTTRPLQ